MRVGIYARVSTLDKRQDTEVQLRDLRSYAQARGWITADEYVDKGQSGAKDRRPELDRLMKDVRKRKVDLSRWENYWTGGLHNLQRSL